MSAEILDGKFVAAEIRADCGRRAASFSSPPCLAVVLIGDNPASAVYVRNKTRACEEAGIVSRKITPPESISESDLLALVDELNRDDSVDGILVQMPLPPQINPRAALEAVSPQKDVDGFHPLNAGRLSAGRDSIPPCTPAGCMELLRRSETTVAGSDAVVVGRSDIVGKPMAAMLINAGATVTVCNSKTRNLAEKTRGADILVAAVGRARMITAEMVRPGAAVLDVGINRTEEGKITGDVDFESVSRVAGKITPVPGGVGPMTVAMLMANTVQAAEARRKGKTE